jgi:hypothetical protein
MVGEEVDPVANHNRSRVGGVDRLYDWIVCLDSIEDTHNGAQDPEQSRIEREHSVLFSVKQ